LTETGAAGALLVWGATGGACAGPWLVLAKRAAVGVGGGLLVFGGWPTGTTGTAPGMSRV
jgi:hypothetical protein